MDKSSNNYVSMLDFYNDKLYIDVEELDKFLLLGPKEGEEVNITEYFDKDGKLESKQVTTNKNPVAKQYDSVKYDLIRYLFESLTIDMDDVDTSLGIDIMAEKMPLPCKLAYNTLAGYGILKKY